MSYEEEFFEDPVYDEEYCDYDVGEFCENPRIKDMGLCTTECSLYLEACDEMNREKTVVQKESREHENAES